MNKKSLIGSVLIISVIIITLLTVIIPTYSYADNSLDSLGLDDLDDYKGTNPGSEKLKSKANIIFSYLSVEEKATYKQTLLPYLIGAILLFTGSLIPQLIYDIMQNF